MRALTCLRPTAVAPCTAEAFRVSVASGSLLAGDDALAGPLRDIKRREKREGGGARPLMIVAACWLKLLLSGCCCRLKAGIVGNACPL